jgi:hypothetical protein
MTSAWRADAVRSLNRPGDSHAPVVFCRLRGRDRPALLVRFARDAQTVPTEFPTEAVVPTAEEMQAHLTNKVFRVTRADGNHWRLQFKDNGYYFVNTVQGFADDGRWRVEGSRLCAEPRKGAAGCSEVRMVGGQLHLKRDQWRDRALRVAIAVETASAAKLTAQEAERQQVAQREALSC